jgi:hypothetical protein
LFRIEGDSRADLERKRTKLNTQNSVAAYFKIQTMGIKVRFVKRSGFLSFAFTCGVNVE